MTGLKKTFVISFPNNKHCSANQKSKAIQVALLIPFTPKNNSRHYFTLKNEEQHSLGIKYLVFITKQIKIMKI